MEVRSGSFSVIQALNVAFLKRSLSLLLARPCLEYGLSAAQDRMADVATKLADLVAV